jgi:hypothetical protein
MRGPRLPLTSTRVLLEELADFERILAARQQRVIDA